MECSRTAIGLKRQRFYGLHDSMCAHVFLGRESGGQHHHGHGGIEFQFFFPLPDRDGETVLRKIHLSVKPVLIEPRSSAPVSFRRLRTEFPIDDSALTINALKSSDLYVDEERAVAPHRKRRRGLYSKRALPPGGISLAAV
jgi:hypothetical protein